MKFAPALLFLAIISATSLRAESTRAHSPFTPFSVEAVLADAHKLAARRAGSQVVRIEGSSMLPYFGDGSVLVTNPIAAADLRPGMVVVYHNRFGETVAHRVERASEGGWIVRGASNSAEDTTQVGDENLVGVVYATLYSSGRTTQPEAFAALVRGTLLALAAPAR